MRFLILTAFLSSLAASAVQALTFPFTGDTVVGELQTIRTKYEDTFVDLGHTYGLGFRHLQSANPGVLPWVPGEGTELTLPTAFVLPYETREAIVINLPEFRLYHFLPEQNQVRTYAIGIGREGWETPTTEEREIRVTTMTPNPSWTPPQSIRRDYASRGITLPAVVRPGPDNPLGKYAIRLTLPSYLVHGTNKKVGIGMRVSAGCIRLYDPDIEELAMSVKPGTPVRIINEPAMAGWRGNRLYLQVHPQLEEKRDVPINLERAIGEALAQRPATIVNIDWDKAREVAAEQRGVPVDITAD